MAREMTMNAKDLTPAEQVAQAMLLLHGKDPMAALTVMNASSSAVAEVFANDPDPSPEDVNAAAEKAIQDLGFVTDLDSLGRQFDYLRDNHAGFWTGNYTLVDSENEVHTLLVNSKQVRLLLGGVKEVVNVPSEGEAFANRTLTVDNDAVAVRLAVSTTVDGVQPTSDPKQLEDLARKLRVMVSGTLALTADGKVRQVKGLRGVATPAAVLHDMAEDPASIWAGEYQLRYTDTDQWEYLRDHLVIDYDDQAQSLGLRLGSVRATDVAYTSGVVRCRLELTRGVASTVTVDLQTTSGGWRKCFVWIETTGQMRTLTGYALNQVDPAILWRSPGGGGAPRSAAAALAVAPAAVAGSVVDFCRTPYDAVFPATGLLAATPNDPGNKRPAGLLTGDTIKVENASDATGFRVDETDANGNSTGRIALFTSTATTPEFPAGAKPKAYQQLDEAGLPQAGLANAMVGILIDKGFELPGLVETDFYEVRLSLTNFASIDSAGLTLSLAIDDARQPGLVVLAQPDPSRQTCAYDANGGNGPDPATMTQIGDYRSASVLVRGATGETQNVGQKTYYLAVTPKTPARVIAASKTVYKPAATAGKFVPDGTATTVQVPILMRVPIQMDSRDALELSGASWNPAVRGKVYSASVTAQKGQQPFVWRVLKSDLPGGLSWDQVNGQAAQEGVDYSVSGKVTFGVSGTVDAGADPGTTYQPVLRVMSDKSVVMKPALAGPQITIAEPETEGKLGPEITMVVASVVATLATVGTLLVMIFQWKKGGNNSDKQKSAEGGIELTNMSEDKLRDIGEKFGSLAEAVKTIKKNSKYIDKLQTALKGYEDFMDKMKSTIDKLETAIENATSKAEVEKLQEELEEARNELEAKERERNKKEAEDDTVDESEKSEGKK
jgi:hypothetical protein